VIEIREYIGRSGRNLFRQWLDEFDKVTGARIATSVRRLETGNFSAAKGIGSGVFELRFDFGPGYRVYFGKDGENLILLLAGGTKARQQKDIETAHMLWQEYKRRKREGK
jgi:putative addiction module killer protein